MCSERTEAGKPALPLDGVYPALVTPFDEAGRPDFDALGEVVEALLAEGAEGLYVGGSTGEALLMTKQERKQVLEAVVRQTGGRAQVLAHIGCLYTGDSIELAEHAARTGADAISSLPPFYYKFSPAELARYYLDILSAVPLPMIVYNAPALTGVSFDSGNVREIFAHPLAVGIKYTSYDLFQMERLISGYPEKTVICGHDELYLSALAVGCRCAVGSTFNFMAPKFRRLRRHFEAGELAEARKLQEEANAVIAALMEVGVFRGVKGMMKLMGRPGGECRRPFAPLTARELCRLEEALPLALS